MMEGQDRSWDSVCGDCERFADGRCAAYGRAADARDSFAAICERYEPARRAPEPPEGK